MKTNISVKNVATETCNVAIAREFCMINYVDRWETNFPMKILSIFDLCKNFSMLSHKHLKLFSDNHLFHYIYIPITNLKKKKKRIELD